MTSREIICPNCKYHIDPDTPVYVIRRGAPRFKWWVAPINLIFISIFLYLLDQSIRFLNPHNIPWSIWAISGIWLIYVLGLVLSYRPEEAWMIVPFFFFLLCVFLASIDLYVKTTQEAIFLGLTWSFYPIVTILVLFVILPLVTFAGRKTKHPVEVLQEIIELEDSETGVEK